ncbi:hypothetical protein [Nonomuraea basaltis]|uniref:hypothetical protein n=1 Tax=Nonomuraea basaltis TaxID=2495887 RepID=UPI00110C661B|nr:hypothetical protein [Nonomuraea basaltis]TMR99522.1 hypothetical protein EJK15_06835 [Nonomuraea basaltis]
MDRPTTCQIVRYRGTQGLHAVRAAIVTADVDTLDPEGVRVGAVPPLDSAFHVHLWVFTPGALGGFHECNVPPGTAPGTAPGTWHWPA